MQYSNPRKEAGVSRRQEGEIPATRSQKGSHASICIGKSGADPLKSVSEDRRGRRSGRTKKVLEKSARRRSRRRISSLRKKVNNKREHPTKLRERNPEPQQEQPSRYHEAEHSEQHRPATHPEERKKE